MSQTATLDFILYDTLNMKHFILILEKNGWSFNDHENIMYLPLGDVDFDWEFESLDSKEKVLNIIEEKQNNNEDIGVTMVEEASNTGGNFLYITKSNRLSFSAQINRKKLENDPYDRFTAIDWYYSKILKGLSDCRVDIQGVEINDY